MLKASAPFKRVVSRLLSEDPASPGADNLVQRLTERIMNPRVGGGPQAMKVHRTNCLLAPKASEASWGLSIFSRGSKWLLLCVRKRLL